MPILFFVLCSGDKFYAFVDKDEKRAIMVVGTTMYIHRTVRKASLCEGGGTAKP